MGTTWEEAKDPSLLHTIVTCSIGLCLRSDHLANTEPQEMEGEMGRGKDEWVYLCKCLWLHDGEYDILKRGNGTEDTDWEHRVSRREKEVKCPTAEVTPNKEGLQGDWNIKVPSAFKYNSQIQHPVPLVISVLFSEFALVWCEVLSLLISLYYTICICLICVCLFLLMLAI